MLDGTKTPTRYAAPAVDPAPRRRNARMKRREFIAAIGSAAVPPKYRGGLFVLASPSFTVPKRRRLPHPTAKFCRIVVQFRQVEVAHTA